ncbi:hypothetical protein GCK32_002384 [Trichostrongylus colubriformis]|uniref:Uncharacterized protein n=1 Tax=Trichostrongylus colubriformis TaxID=6319 RepID=A0AAN8F2N9_TRICO
MSDRILLVLLLFAVLTLLSHGSEDSKVAKSRVRRCAQQLNMAMTLQCRSITDESCELIRELYALDAPLDPEDRDRLLERKCCERRCSLQVLRSFCCLI